MLKKIDQQKPELVAPAGDWPSLISAVENGADSVYFGIKGLNMRNLQDNFDILEMKKIMRFLHERKKKGYLALNVFIRNQEIAKAEKILRAAKSAGVDAVVLWDMAVLSLAKKIGLPFHVSTQASVANSAAFDFFSRLGAQRIILARECSLAEIRQISDYRRKKRIKCRIEAFVHGAMCISVSGRCFLSSLAGGKSANRGECLQYCRREYTIKDDQEEAEFVLGQDYVLSAKDLCTIDFLDQMIKSGIDAFKIEGRRRSPEYVKVVTAVYRRAIDNFFSGSLDEAEKARLKVRLSEVFNRGFSAGFYFGMPESKTSQGLENRFEKFFIGEVTKFFKKINVAQIHVQNGVLRQGEELLFFGKNTPVSLARANEIQQNHVFVKKVKKGEQAGIKLPFAVKPKDKVFIWREKG